MSEFCIDFCPAARFCAEAIPVLENTAAEVIGRRDVLQEVADTLGDRTLPREYQEAYGIHNKNETFDTAIDKANGKLLEIRHARTSLIERIAVPYEDIKDSCSGPELRRSDRHRAQADQKKTDAARRLDVKLENQGDIPFHLLPRLHEAAIEKQWINLEKYLGRGACSSQGLRHSLRFVGAFPIFKELGVSRPRSK